MQQQKKIAGFSTLEILVAMAVILIAVSQALPLVLSSQKLMLDSQASARALRLAGNLLALSRATAAQDWDSLAPQAAADGSFTETTAISDLDDGKELVTADVSWQQSGQNHLEQLSALIENWNFPQGTGSCAQFPQGDWSRPKILGSVDLGATGPAVGVAAKPGLAYVAANGNSSEYDFFTIDTSASPPQIISPRIDTGPGLAAVAVSGNYAYLGNTSINSQLQILNLGNFSRTDFKLPGSGSGDTATSIYYYDHTVYLGIKKSPIAELHIIDVSDPTHPQEIGSWEFNTTVNAIYVSNGKAYIATPDNNKELQVLDVSNRYQPKFLTSFDAPGSSGSGKSIFRYGGNIFLGRTVGNIELYDLDINNISGPPAASQDIGSSINGLAVQGSLVFLATNDSNKPFQVWDTSDMGHWKMISSLVLPYAVTAMFCQGQQMYITTQNPAQGLIIIGAS